MSIIYFENFSSCSGNRDFFVQKRSSFAHASKMRFYFETEHPAWRKTSDPGIHGPIFHGFRIGPHFQFFNGPNLNPYRSKSGPEMNGHGHEFGHEFMSESMSEADSDTDMRLFGTSDTDSDTDMDKVMTSDTDTGSDTHRSDNLGHEFGLGHAFGHAFRHDVRVSKILLFLIRSKFLVGRDPVRSNESVILYCQ